MLCLVLGGWLWQTVLSPSGCNQVLHVLVWCAMVYVRNAVMSGMYAFVGTGVRGRGREGNGTMVA